MRMELTGEQVIQRMIRNTYSVLIDGSKLVFFKSLKIASFDSDIDDIKF